MKKKIAALLFLLTVVTVIFGMDKDTKALHENKLVPSSYFDRSGTEKELEYILNAIAEKKPDYTIKVFKEKHGGWLSPIWMYRYHINNIPGDLVNRFKKLWTSHRLKKYLFDRKYSFYLALLLLEDRRYGPPPEKIQPLIDENKNEWDNEIEKYAEIFIELYKLPSNVGCLYYIFEEMIPGNKHLPDGGYIEGDYSKQLTKMKSTGYNIDGYRERLDNSDYTELYLVADMVANAIKEYNSKGDSKYFAKIDTEKYGFRPWFYFIFNSSEKDVSYNIKPFIAYLRKQPERKPLHSAIVMSLFIVFGYDFDEKTGNYIPNEIGKTMLDYIVENPIPENAERLKIIRDGGNGKLISELMEKHKTKEKWAELWSEERQ